MRPIVRSKQSRRGAWVQPLALASIVGAAALSIPSSRAATSVGVGVGVTIPIGQPVAPVYGSVATVLPAGAVSVRYRGGRYWHAGGVWYEPWGPRWVVVAPPPGVTFVDGVPVGDGTPPAPVRPDPVIVPRNQQSPQQTEADRQACNRWAVTQPAALANAATFQRAVEVCLDARGYTTK